MTVAIYTKANCPNCVTAKNLMKSRGIAFVEIDAETPQVVEWFARDYPGVRQMPQIFVRGHRIGGLEGLRANMDQILKVQAQ